jgi:[acyl-carrier-protein] S-malonyltransferase
MGRRADSMVDEEPGCEVKTANGVAYIFPGQGSQYVGMGKDLFDAHQAARKVFERADEILGLRLSTICFEGPDEELKQTKYTQPAIFLHSIAVASMIRGEKAAMAAGHSLGEYSALVYAGALSFEDGLRLVRLRGELMHQAGLERPGTMAAVVGLSPAQLESVCRNAEDHGIVRPANFNSPGQIVISGSVAGVHRAIQLAKEAGAKLAKELPVSGAFHSPLMEPARDGLKVALDKVTIRDAELPVYANVTARPVRRADEIRRLLFEQLTSPVRWEETITAMVADGATRFVEVGPGKVLQNLVKRIAPAVESAGLEKATDIG